MSGRFDVAAGERLKQIRRERGWNRLDVERHMRWPPGTLRYVERGKVPLTLEHASEIGALYDCAVDDMLETG